MREAIILILGVLAGTYLARDAIFVDTLGLPLSHECPECGAPLHGFTLDKSGDIKAIDGLACERCRYRVEAL